MSANHRRNRSPFILSTTVDFPDDLRHGIYTPALLDEMMRLLKSKGVTRVYWNYYGDIDPDSYWAGSMYRSVMADPNDPATRTGYQTETLNLLGEPVRAAVPVAHRHGLELYATLKPYDPATSATYPEGSPEAPDSRVGRIGGTLRSAIPFIERHPHTRIRRRPFDAPPALQSEPIRRIRLLKKDDSPTRVRRENIEIWTSDNNYGYQRRNVEFQLKEAVEPAPHEVRDFYSRLVTAKGAPVRTLTLDGLDLTDRYILVTTNFSDDTGDFRNTALGMVEACGSTPEPLPIVVAIKGGFGPPEVRDFRASGLDFDSGNGPVEVALDVDNSSSGTGAQRTDDGLIAFARGKNEHLPQAPCEVYPEVRKLWAGYVDRLIEAGVDGIDVRWSSHCACTDEPREYGFNEPLLEEYRQRYGADPLGDGVDLGRLAELRGEHYTSFIREASGKMRGAGKKFQVHVHTDTSRLDPVHQAMVWTQANIHFDWKTWVREELLDGITLRIGTETLEPGPEGVAMRNRFPHSVLSKTLADPVAIEALELANQAGVPVYLNRYVSRPIGGTDEYVADLESIFHDDRFAGLDLYEMASMATPTPDGSRLVPVEDRLERFGAKSAELGIT